MSHIPVTLAQVLSSTRQRREKLLWRRTARMLIDLGIDPKAAVHRVRAVRLGAIETDEKLQYVLHLEPLPKVRLDPLPRGIEPAAFRIRLKVQSNLRQAT